MKTLHVIPHTQPHRITRELDLLISTQHDGQDAMHVLCLGQETAITQSWRASGIGVEVLRRKHPVDPRTWWRLGCHIREKRPDVICVWGPHALRAVRLAAPRSGIPVLLRTPFAGGGFSLTSLERWLLRGVDLVLASSMAEAKRCTSLGLPAARVQVVLPGVQLGIPASKLDSQRIVAVGQLLPHQGFYEAIWAFDILHFANPDAELLIVGDGPERQRLQKFVARTEQGRRIHLLGPVADLAAVLSQASVMWVPSLADCGAGAALEAMAAGLPVVASRWPGLAEIVVDGETGCLVTPDDKVDLARQTHRLLHDSSLRRRLGQGGLRLAATRFSGRQFVEKWDYFTRQLTLPGSPQLEPCAA